MKYLIILLISFNVIISAQGNVAQFAVWDPKEGMGQKFEEGYKKHLQWHKNNNDTWDWYGWFITSGTRAGQFVDATFDHTWGDFDSPVNPQGDRADNRLNVYPYADLKSVFKVVKISPENNESLKSKFIRFITVSFNSTSDIKIMLSELRKKYIEDKSVTNFNIYKIVDGGDINQIIILIGFNSWDEYGKTEALMEDLSDLEKENNETVIKSITSETMIYREDMSLFAE